MKQKSIDEINSRINSFQTSHRIILYFRNPMGSKTDVLNGLGIEDLQNAIRNAYSRYYSDRIFNLNEELTPEGKQHLFGNVKMEYNEYGDCLQFYTELENGIPSESVFNNILLFLSDGILLFTGMGEGYKEEEIKIDLSYCSGKMAELLKKEVIELMEEIGLTLHRRKRVI